MHLTANTVIAVQTPSATYEVEIGAHLIESIGTRIDALLSGEVQSGKQRGFVAPRPEIARLWGARLDRGFPPPPTRLIVPAGEEHKRLTTVERLAEELAQHGADRDSIL